MEERKVLKVNNYSTRLTYFSIKTNYDLEGTTLCGLNLHTDYTVFASLIIKVLYVVVSYCQMKLAKRMKARSTDFPRLDLDLIVSYLLLLPPTHP